MGSEEHRLFAVNCSLGCGAAERADFQRPADLLAHLDRLRIERALVYNIEARDGGVTFGNQRLLDWLDACPQAEARLLPAFVVTPTMLYKKGAVDHLVQAVGSGRVRALRLCPATMTYRLPHLIPLMRQVPGDSLILLLSIRELSDERDVTELADAFRHLPLVLTDAMWGHLPMLCHLMQTHNNIHADLSWMHVWGALPLLKERFGAHRLLFGIGHASHQGAAIGYLRRANLSERERRLVSRANLERLLGIPSLATPPRWGDSANPRWEAFAAGGKLPYPGIDAHAHLGANNRWLLAETDTTAQAEAAVAEMDDLGIETMIVSHLEALFTCPVEGNDHMRELLQPFGARFRGYVAFNPHYADELAPRLDEWFADPFFVGFKLLCDYWKVPVDDEGFRPVYEYANAHRLPILLHTWTGSHDAPAMLADVAPEYPDAVFLLGHSGGTDAGRLQAEQLVRDCPNVYLEWCGSFCARRRWEETLGEVDPKRVVFGSDAMAHSLTWELSRLVSLDVPDDVLRPIYGETMREILARQR